MAVVALPELSAICALMVNGCGVEVFASINMTMSELAVAEGPTILPVPAVSLMIEPEVAFAVGIKMPPTVNVFPLRSIVCKAFTASR